MLCDAADYVAPMGLSALDDYVDGLASQQDVSLALSWL